MKRFLFFLAIGWLTVSMGGAVFARNASVEPQQSGQQPSMKKNQRDQTKPTMGSDSSAPGQRKRPRLRPDSLRRGGATRVDTI